MAWIKVISCADVIGELAEKYARIQGPLQMSRNSRGWILAGDLLLETDLVSVTADNFTLREWHFPAQLVQYEPAHKSNYPDRGCQ